MVNCVNKNDVKLLLVGICLVILCIIIWVAYDSNALTAFSKNVPLSVAKEYGRTSSYYDTDVEKCQTIENETSVYVVEVYLNNVMSDHTYFNINGSLICGESTHADRTQITEGTSCPQTTTCENIISKQTN